MSEILFDLFDLLVNNVFGGIFTAIMGVALILVLIMVITRCSLLLMIYWVGFYLTVTMTLYFGGLFMTLAFIFLAVFLTYNIIKIVEG